MRILLVEDNKKIADSIKKGLEQETYSVDVIYNGEEGLDMALSENYDLFILDWMLPDVSGIDILKELRDDGINTPVLMLTAKTQIEDKVEGLNVGADDYLTKPFAFEELLARIRALLRRPQEIINNQLSCADLSLNLTNFEVTRANTQIELSKKEYALLEYLLRNKDNILSKEQIIEHVWNFDSDVLPNTVEVYIGYLRNKIDAPFKSAKLIKTVRGFGYKISDR